MQWKEECRIKHIPSRMYLTTEAEESKDGYKVFTVNYNYYDIVGTIIARCR